MAYSENWQEIERAAGRRAASALQSALRGEIKRSFRTRTGAMDKTTVTARMLHGQLDRLVITSPNYSFVQHYGYSEPAERVKAGKRRGTRVSGHFRGGLSGTTVNPYFRAGGYVPAYTRNIKDGGTGHISKAIDSSNILDTLADALAESRAVVVVNKIRFDGR